MPRTRRCPPVIIVGRRAANTTQPLLSFTPRTLRPSSARPPTGARPPQCARRVGTGPTLRERSRGGGALGAGTVYFYATSAAIVTVTSTPTLEGGRVFTSDDPAATVTAARTVADGRIEGPPPRRVSPHAASSMLEKGKRNKNGTNDIGIQAFDAILQLGVGC